MSTSRQVDITVNVLQGSTLSGPSPSTGITAALQAAGVQPRQSTFAPPTSSAQGISFDRYARDSLMALRSIASAMPGASAVGSAGGFPTPPPKPGWSKWASEGPMKAASGIADLGQASNNIASSWTQLLAGTPAAETFTRSVQMLGLTVGNTLAPGLDKASGQIQRMAHWIDHLDPSTKRTIGTFASWSGVAIGTGVALNTIGIAVRPLTGLFSGLNKAITGTSKSLGIPVWAGWAAAGAAAIGTIAALTTGFGLLGDRIERVSRMSDESRANIERLNAGAPLDRENYEASLRRAGSRGLGLMRNVEEATPANRQGIIQSEIQDLELRRRDLVARQPAQLQARIEQALQAEEATGIAGTLGNTLGEGLNRRALAIARAMGMDVSTVQGQAAAIDRFSPMLPRVTVPGTGIPITNMTPGTYGPETISRIAREASGVNRLSGFEDLLGTLRAAMQRGVPGLLTSQNDGTMRSQQLVPPQLYGSGTQVYESMLTEAMGKTQFDMDRQQKIMEQIEQNTRPAPPPPPTMPRRGG